MRVISLPAQSRHHLMAIGANPGMYNLNHMILQQPNIVCLIDPSSNLYSPLNHQMGRGQRRLPNVTPSLHGKTCINRRSECYLQGMGISIVGCRFRVTRRLRPTVRRSTFLMSPSQTQVVAASVVDPRFNAQSTM
jgi:hypothetical protein